MSPILPGFLKPKHGWTSSRRIPWRTDETLGKEAGGKDAMRRFGLFRMLSGAGRRLRGELAAEEIASRKRTRFLFLAAALAALWTYFLLAPAS